MKISTDRILTTHVGSLPRPRPLIDLILAREQDRAVDEAEFDRQVAQAVNDIVAKQVEGGIDVVNDGEISKPSYTMYVRHRVSGIKLDQRAAEKGRDIMISRDALAFPDVPSVTSSGRLIATRSPTFRPSLRFAIEPSVEAILTALKRTVSLSSVATVGVTPRTISPVTGICGKLFTGTCSTT